MPGLECSKTNFHIPLNGVKDLFGFFYCKIDSPIYLYLGFLPVRTKNGMMMG